LRENSRLSRRGYVVVPGEQIFCFCPFIPVLVGVRLVGQNLLFLWPRRVKALYYWFSRDVIAAMLVSYEQKISHQRPLLGTDQHGRHVIVILFP
jgi:hypothetical protein